MLYLGMAILSSAAMALALRAVRDPGGNRFGILLGNYLSCTLLALLLTPRGVSVLEGGGSTLWLGAVSGFFYVAALVCMQASIHRNGAGLSSAFAKSGLLVSLLASLLLFGERPGWLQLLGVGLILGAMGLIYSGQGTAQGSGRRFGLLLLTLLCNGCADAMAKVFEQLGSPAANTAYFFWLFLTAFLLTGLLALGERQKSGKPLRLREALMGAAVGVPNYFSSYLLLLALRRLPAFLVFPLFSTGTILTVLLAGRLLFGEKLSRRQGLGICLILGALILLNQGKA